VTPSVTVRGPNAYVKLIAATQTLTGLASGSYTLSAATFMAPDSIVSTLFAGAVGGSPATVTADDTSTATVNYARAPGSGYLWSTTSVDNYSVEGWTPALLSASGTPTPAITIGPTNGSLFQPQHTVFDSSGNMWVENFDTLIAYTPAQIGASGTPVPAVTIGPTGGSLNGPFSMAFDSHGYLWVVNVVNSNVVAYSPQQLATSGTPAPAITLTSDSAFHSPEGLAFDAHGNLWVTSWVNSTPPPTGSLQSFTPSELAAGGAQVPTVTIRGEGLAYPSSLAFDASGDLWVSNDGYSAEMVQATIAEYTPAQLAAGGTQTPNVLITGPALNGPDGLAFDNSGNLWVANGINSANETIIEYSASQLTASGSPTPVVTLMRSGNSTEGVTGLTFYPHAVGLPIN
jgi:sugar lactone lactonase YvrE